MTARMVSSIEAGGRPPCRGAAQVGGGFQQIQHAPRIAVRGRQQQIARRRHRSAGAAPPSPARRSASARSSNLPRSSAVERLQHIDARPRQQRVVDFERRVLGGGADEDQRAVLDVGQKGVLLRLVEAMHLIEKQHRVARAAQAARLLDHRADILDAGQHGRQRDEFAHVRRWRPGAPSVVLPVPGGPHRIIECGWPDSSARRSGAPAPSK